MLASVEQGVRRVEIHKSNAKVAASAGSRPNKCTMKEYEDDYMGFFVICVLI